LSFDDGCNSDKIARIVATGNLPHESLGRSRAPPHFPPSMSTFPGGKFIGGYAGQEIYVTHAYF
jgi:hypothetical protein